MKIAQELGKSVEEVMQFSVLEIKLWYAWFKMQADEQRKVMDGANKHTSKRRRSNR